jgi:hypothetical protein
MAEENERWKRGGPLTGRPSPREESREVLQLSRRTWIAWFLFPAVNLKLINAADVTKIGDSLPKVSDKLGSIQCSHDDPSIFCQAVDKKPGSPS